MNKDIYSGHTSRGGVAMETHRFSYDKKPVYLVGDENDMILLSDEEYTSIWNGNVATPKVVHKGYFYSTYDQGLNNGLFFQDTANIIAEVRNGQVYTVSTNGMTPFASEG